MMRPAMVLAIFAMRVAAQEPASCVIGGVVTDDNTDRPVERARVIVRSKDYSLTTLTDDRGAYCFPKLSASDYRLLVQKAGYLESWHPSVLAIEPDSKLKPLALRITRYAVVSGTVQNEEGEIVPGVTVRAYLRKRSGPEQWAEVSSSGKGAFEISRLEPGSYYLSAQPDDDYQSRYSVPFAGENGQFLRDKEIETFYPASFSFDAATPVPVKAGQRIDSLVLTIRKMRLRRVTGVIANPPPVAFLSYHGETETGTDSMGAIPIGKDGVFAKVDLPPARYTFALNDGTGTIAEKNVDLTLGDALNIVLDPVETFDIPVILHTEGKGPPYRPGMDWSNVLLLHDGTNQGVGLEPASDGTYHFPAAIRGIYQLHFDPANENLYVKTVTYGGETETSNRIDLRTIRPGGFEITLSPNVAAVSGTVTLPDDKDSDLSVILVKGTDLVKETGTDQKGRFRMPSVAPGKYRLLAIEDFDRDDWGNPLIAKALESKSVEVDLKENDKKQVEVKPVSADEFAAALKKLGG